MTEISGRYPWGESKATKIGKYVLVATAAFALATVAAGIGADYALGHSKFRIDLYCEGKPLGHVDQI